MTETARPGDHAPATATPPPRRAAGWGGDSGPAIAGLFHRALAGVFLLAWLSLAVQVNLLVGSRGLMPLVDLVEAARAQGVLSIVTFPSLLALAPGDGVLLGGTLVGVALALLGVAGVWPRLCAVAQTILYLGYVTACRTFLAFQWDNLLLECGLLAAFLPAHRRAPVAHFLFRALLFKLYFESGLAKWQSPAFDWRDGSAMTFYYETAPLPTALAWYAHHLPRWWHLFESRATLVIELVVPFAAFGPRRARVTAAAVFTLFQVLNVATANYGFFCLLSAALHLFLLDDADLQRLTGWWTRRARWARGLWRWRWVDLSWLSRWRAGAPVPAPRPSPAWRRVAVAAAVAGVGAWMFVSLGQAIFHFGDPGRAAPLLSPTLEVAQAFRVVNTYHLFAAITRERIEPEFQTLVDGRWSVLELRHKPGDPAHAPGFVAPHQPRVDFQLWFYGLAHDRRQPAYVAQLLARLCEDPDAVAPLFVSPPPRLPDAVRVVFWRYAFTSRAERRTTGDWWSRRPLESHAPMVCDQR